MPLPSSRSLKPWLYRTPIDPGDAVSMLGIFLDEEVVTTVAQSARLDDAGRLVLAPCGFERSGPLEHERLLRSAGIDGDHGRQTEAGPLDSRGGRRAPRDQARGHERWNTVLDRREAIPARVGIGQVSPEGERG